MRCKSCNKEIDEYEIFCNECKKKLKKSSSRTDVTQLEQLIEERKKMDDLEVTKELDSLKDLADEVDNNHEFIEEQQDINNIEIKSKELNDTVRQITNEISDSDIDSEFININKTKNWVIIIIIVLLLLALSGIILVYMFNRNKDKSNNNINSNQIDYQLILEEYGDIIKNIVDNYEEDEITWQKIDELNTYSAHEIYCEVHEIYEDKNIYLDDCKIDNKKIKFSYGIKQEIIKEGKKLDIYKISTNSTYYYTNDSKNSTKVGTVTCKTEDCTYGDAFDKYVVVKENNEFYLYNYETDTLEFGPFNTGGNSLTTMLIRNNNVLYAIYYLDDKNYNLYSVKNLKNIKNLEGKFINSNDISNIYNIYESGYAMFLNNGVYNFINLNTGNISFTIKGNIKNIIKDSNNISYMLVYDNLNDEEYKVYNSNGKLLFNGDKISLFYLYNNKLVVGNNTNYKVYDSKLNLKTASKTYDNILGVYNGYIAVVKDLKLSLVDYSDNDVVIFNQELPTNFKFHNEMSGFLSTNSKSTLYLVLEDTSVTNSELPKAFKYYYVESTKEQGIIEMMDIN